MKIEISRFYVGWWPDKIMLYLNYIYTPNRILWIVQIFIVVAILSIEQSFH